MTAIAFEARDTWRGGSPSSCSWPRPPSGSSSGGPRRRPPPTPWEVGWWTSAASESGTPYCDGGGGIDGPSNGGVDESGCGAGVKGFDCMSLVQYAVYQATGIALPGDGSQPKGVGTVIEPVGDDRPGHGPAAAGRRRLLGRERNRRLRPLRGVRRGRLRVGRHRRGPAGAEAHDGVPGDDLLLRRRRPVLESGDRLVGPARRHPVVGSGVDAARRRVLADRRRR